VFPSPSMSSWPVTQPPPNAAREWARLAKRAGQKYMVMTTKHHEGFCHFDTKLTDYARQAGSGPRPGPRICRCGSRRGPARWLLLLTHGLAPSRRRSLQTDEAARKRFVAYTHGLIRELMTNYGKIDVLWYDVDWPLTPQEWESERMNQMVFELQPDIIVNNRNGWRVTSPLPNRRSKHSEGAPRMETCHDPQR